MGRRLAQACCAASNVDWSTPGGSENWPLNPPPPPPRPLRSEPDELLPPDWFAGRVGSVTPCWLRQSRYAWKWPLDDDGAGDDALEAAATLPPDPEHAAANNVPATTNAMIPTLE